jgi:hypothetical protein
VFLRPTFTGFYRGFTGKKTPKPASLLSLYSFTGFSPKNVYKEKIIFSKKSPFCFLARETFFAVKPVNLSNLNNDAPFQTSHPVKTPVNPCQTGAPC